MSFVRQEQLRLQAVNMSNGKNLSGCYLQFKGECGAERSQSSEEVIKRNVIAENNIFQSVRLREN